MCTNMERTRAINIGVEVFRWGGSIQNDISAGEGIVLGVNPGRNVIFATVGVAAFVEDAIIDVPPPVIIIAQLFFRHGSARIVSNSTKLICTAMLVSETGSPPASVTALQVIKKKNQKGD